MGFYTVGTGAISVRQGVLIPSGQILSNNNAFPFNNYLAFDPPTTACYSVFIFDVAQKSTLFSYTSTLTNNTYVSLMINNGMMRLESNYWTGFSPAPLPTRETISNNMYQTGWNLICYTHDGTNYNFLSFPHFTTPAMSESTPNTNYNSTTFYFGIFGGNISNLTTTVSNSLNGIMNKIYMKPTFMTEAQIISSFITPISTSAATCDYFISMFNNLGSMVLSSFTNLQYNYNSQTQSLVNSISSPVDPTDGLLFTSGQTQSISNVKITSQRAVGVQFWFKGTFINGNRFAIVSRDSIKKSVYLERSGTDINLKTTYSSNIITFANAASLLDSSMWIYIGMSVGWMARNNDFMICGYIFQSSSSYEYGNCNSAFTITPAEFSSSSIFTVDFGPGLNGYVKEVYITDILEHPSVYQLFKNSFGGQRYYCFDTTYHTDPHYFKSGCGNGYVLPLETTENCDDENTVNTDGCTNTCTLQSQYKCVHWIGISGSDKCYLSCGDNIYDPGSGEACDNGNPSTSSGCTSACAVVSGWDCSSSISGFPSTCIGICGDGKRVSSESCDDGNKSDGKGCLSDCSGSINGWHCTGGTTSTADICTEQCNDGFITSAEQCEDGNISNGDGCSNTCQIESGWSCVNNPLMTSSICSSICGDGKRVGSEICDDGNNLDNKGCLSDCTGSINGWHCSGGTTTTADICTEQCNDGYITTSEQCEDGNLSNLDGCNNSCYIENGWNCINNPSLTISVCTSICGDNYRVAGEVCDDGDNTDNQGCKSDCSGSFNGWHCSGGSDTSKDICSQQCDDGYITTSEQCEDGNLSNGDGCNSSCLIEFGWSCLNNPGLTSSVCSPKCGDGIIIGGEICDDGDSSDNQGCKSDCTGSLYGWYCSGGSLTSPSICNEKCGDSIITTHERCDDGNAFNLDGCNSKCQIETGWQCSYDLILTKSICTKLCGNRIIDKGEDCDDGNQVDGDGCSSVCKSENKNCNSQSTNCNLDPSKTEKQIGISIQASISTALLLNIATSAIFGVSFTDFWCFINVLQILHYLPMFTLYFPSNVLIMFSYIGIVNMENEYFSEIYLYHINQEDLSFKEALNYRIDNQGYSSTSILLNCSDLFFSFILMIFYYFVISILSLCLREQNNSSDNSGCKRCYKSIIKFILKERSNLFFNSILRISLEVFLDLTFCCGLNLCALTFKNFTDTYSSCVTLFCILCSIVFCFLILCYSLCNLHFLNTKHFEILREELKMNKSSKLYFLLFICKRILLICLIILCRHSGLIQSLSFNAMSICILIYFIVARPYLSKVTNIQETLYELIIIIIVFIFLSYTNQSTEFANSGFPSFLGWICIGLVISTIIINYISQIINVCIKIKEMRESKNKVTQATIQTDHPAYTRYVSSDVSISRSINLEMPQPQPMIRKYSHR